ncbi:MAG TPA: aldo/keto reductase, partial [Polyangiaceae bacterium LLY-WYZ-15_(1-7)]|nr:aldo/keto reductase [Polyangiaceae bacterium LLY-WYZ-15_(1-7)]
MTIATFPLNDGHAIPALGLGTWKSADDDAYRAVKEALRVGYQHIDGAWIYGNEEQVGRALAESVAEGVVAREDVFVTTKLW